MSIDRKEYINTIIPGLKSNKDYKKFFYRFKIEGKTYYTTFDYSTKTWDKRTKVSKAQTDSSTYKENKINPVTELDENIKLHTFKDMHFSKLPYTTWTKTKSKHYDKYIHKYLGNKKLTTIKQMHIKECIKSQEDLGLKPRTIKTTIEILNPIFKEAIANRLITFNPCDGIRIKLPRTKKIVLHASEELSLIYQAIVEIFKDNPYYLSFYLFALQGRRKSEILNLKWEHIDFKSNRYLLEDTKNGEHQMFFLPPAIKLQLKKFNNNTGWIYESSIKKGFKINNVEKQTNKIKKIFPKFTLHYMRNVIVSAMAEQGVSATLMSGALGHNNTSTLSKYLSLNHVQGSLIASQTIENIIE